MIKNLYWLFNIFITVLITTLVLFAIIKIVTNKYSVKHNRFYYLLFGLNYKTIIIFSTCLLNFILSFYYLFNVESFTTVLYATIFLSIIECIFASNIYYIFINGLFMTILLYLYYVFLILNNYMELIYINNVLILLKTLFIIAIVMFSFYTIIRKSEVLLNKKRAKRFSMS